MSVVPEMANLPVSVTAPLAVKIKLSDIVEASILTPLVSVMLIAPVVSVKVPIFVSMLVTAWFPVIVRESAVILTVVSVPPASASESVIAPPEELMNTSAERIPAFIVPRAIDVPLRVMSFASKLTVDTTSVAVITPPASTVIDPFAVSMLASVMSPKP